MKICYIFSNFHLASHTAQPAIVLSLAKAQAERGNKVFIVSNSATEKTLCDKGYGCFLINGEGILRTYLLNIFKIARYLNVIKPDIIHVHGYLLMLFVWFISRFNSFKLFCSVCETIDTVNLFYRKLVCACINNSLGIVVSCEYIKKQLLENGISNNKILVARTGLDNKFRLSDKKDLIFDTDVFYYGDSKRERGFDIIFKLAQKLPSLKFRALLRWQDKDCQDELRCMKNMPNVDILYYPFKEELTTLILKSRLVILPYRWMSVRPPLTLIEPLALGKCVVTSSLEGNEEIIKNGHNGIILDFCDIEKAASEIFKLCNDEILIKKIGERAAKDIEKMYSQDEYEKVFSLYAKHSP